MTDDTTPGQPPHPFHVRTVHYLVRMMSKHDLTQVFLREGDQVIKLRRGPKSVKVAVPVETAQPAVAAMTPGSSAAGVAEAPARTADARSLIDIKSPTPGTFYVASSPEAEPFVRVGNKVKPDTIVCVIEAMKVFNEIPAECSGAIVEILVQNQQSVEYGQALFRVDPAG